MSFNWRRPKKEKVEKGERETLTQRLRLCFLGRIHHKRAQSAWLETRNTPDMTAKKEKAFCWLVSYIV